MQRIEAPFTGDRDNFDEFLNGHKAEFTELAALSMQQTTVIPFGIEHAVPVAPHEEKNPMASKKRTGTTASGGTRDQLADRD